MKVPDTTDNLVLISTHFFLTLRRLKLHTTDPIYINVVGKVYMAYTKDGRICVYAYTK